LVEGLISPRIILSEIDLRKRLAPNALLLAACDIVINNIFFFNPNNWCAIILCDSELVCLKIFADSQIMKTLISVGISPGAYFTEESFGTNSLAIAKKYKSLVVLDGEKHYCRMFKECHCAAAPLMDYNSRHLGFLGLCMYDKRMAEVTLSFLKIMISSIKKELYILNLSGGRQEEELFFETSILLTPREREILHHIGSGLTNSEIANNLFVSQETVKTHKKNIYRKFNVNKLSELILKLQNRY
jgi:Response regulator containing a CheY-like receiver domain and an HTH DNA-binding domain